MKLLTLSLLLLLLLIVHEWGHYLTYRLFGIKAYVRRSILRPGVSPVSTVAVSRHKAFVIALSGFLVSTIVVILPLIPVYSNWRLLLVGSIIGSSVDFLWAFSMLHSQTVTIHPVGKPWGGWN